MSGHVQTGRIEIHDIEELNYCVDPWQLRMQQMSAGPFRASIDLLQINGILLTRERWSQSVIANGATPEGYLALSCTSTRKSFLYCGQDIKQGYMSYGFDATEIDFQTPINEDHWVILVPKDLLLLYLGEELAANVPQRQRVIPNERRLTRRLVNRWRLWQHDLRMCRLCLSPYLAGLCHTQGTLRCERALLRAPYQRTQATER